MKKRIILSLLVIGLSLLAYTSIAKDSKKMTIENINIIVNEEEKDFFNRNKKYLNRGNHPTGVTFYKIDTNEKYNTVTLNVGDSKIKLDYPLSVRTPMNKIRKVRNVSISLGIGLGGKTSHKIAKDRMYDILKNFRDDGWNRYIRAFDPRIKGKEVLQARKDLDELSIPLDDEYIMNIEEWLNLRTYEWNFYYKDEAEIQITLHREGTNHDIKGSDGYYLSMQLITVEEILQMNHRKQNVRDRSTFTQVYLKNNKRKRKEKEEKAVKLGYKIDTDYKNAPYDIGIFKDYKAPEELYMKSNEVCQKSGLWESILPLKHKKILDLHKSEYREYICKKGSIMPEIKFLEEDKDLIKWRFLGELKGSY